MKTRLVLMLLLLSGIAWAKPDYRYTQDWTTQYAALWEQYLQRYADQADVHALEVGAFEGRSSVWFLKNILTAQDSTITCLDIFDGKFAENFDHNLKVSGFSSRMTKIKGNSRVELRKLTPASYDFIYIDASHMSAAVLDDACLCWPLLKPGGILIFDDYRFRSEVKKPTYTPKIAIDLFLNAMDAELDTLYRGYQVVIRKKKPKPTSQSSPRP